MYCLYLHSRQQHNHTSLLCFDFDRYPATPLIFLLLCILLVYSSSSNCTRRPRYILCWDTFRAVNICCIFSFQFFLSAALLSRAIKLNNLLFFINIITASLSPHRSAYRKSPASSQRQTCPPSLP